MVIAVIPARGGSKRIADKNIRLFCGKSIIAYSIESALQSEVFDRVIVSTDSEQIAEVANSYGAETPFLRPPELADDHTPTIPVIKHAIETLEATTGAKPVSFACCIYATAPFIQAADLQAGFNVLKSDSETDFCFTATSFPFPIWRAIKIADQKVEMFWPENGDKRSQDLEEAYHDAGQFYWGTSHAWRNASNIFKASSTAVVVPRSRVQDIDTPEDWQRAEAMYHALNEAEKS